MTFFITYQTPPVHGASCGPAKAKTLSYYQKNFFFVSLPKSGARITRRGIKTVGGSKCPWVWKTTDDAARKPRALVMAECSKALCKNNSCLPVYYTHHVLMEKCDKTGIKVWVMVTQRLPIAYVSDKWLWKNEKKRNRELVLISLTRRKWRCECQI